MINHDHPEEEAYGLRCLSRGKKLFREEILREALSLSTSYLIPRGSVCGSVAFVAPVYPCPHFEHDDHDQDHCDERAEDDPDDQHHGAGHGLCGHLRRLGGLRRGRGRFDVPLLVVAGLRVDGSQILSVTAAATSATTAASFAEIRDEYVFAFVSRGRQWHERWRDEGRRRGVHRVEEVRPAVVLSDLIEAGVIVIIVFFFYFGEQRLGRGLGDVTAWKRERESNETISSVSGHSLVAERGVLFAAKQPAAAVASLAKEQKAALSRGEDGKRENNSIQCVVQRYVQRE